MNPPRRTRFWLKIDIGSFSEVFYVVCVGCVFINSLPTFHELIGFL